MTFSARIFKTIVLADYPTDSVQIWTFDARHTYDLQKVIEVSVPRACAICEDAKCIREREIVVLMMIKLVEIKA